MRFLHLADIHLDTLFAGRSDGLRRRLRDATREAFARGLALAREEGVDAVLLAGDLFDGDRLSLASERFLLEACRELLEAGIPLFHATGNHDPAGAVTRMAWPAGVEIFASADPRTVPVVREGEVVGSVTGAGHEGPAEHRDLSRGFRPPPGRTTPAVAMLHTQVGGARSGEGHDRYAPSELAFLRGAGFDYWALGHIHLRQELDRFPGIHYPGNVQGRSPRETGAKGGLLVELPGAGLAPHVDFVELAPVRWELLELSGLAEVETLEGLCRAVVPAWRVAREGDPGRPGTEWILRLRLAGPSPLHRLLRDPEEAETLAGELRARLGVLEVEVRTEGLRAALDPGPALERQDAAGEALRLARALQDPSAPSPSRALRVGAGELAGFSGESEEELDAYLRELLEGSERELLDRFRE